jgi:hypothetical protein
VATAFWGNALLTPVGGLQIGAGRTDSVSMKSLSIALLRAVVSVAVGGSDPLAGLWIEEIEEGLS